MLENIWFFIWGLLWAIYFMLDGFDLGAGSLMPFITKNEKDRDQIYDAIGPFWDGNEVWLITAGGVMFAAFPAAYAGLFSALYSPLMLILFALIIRGSAVALRAETDSALGRRVWDWCFTIGSFLPMLLFGVAFGNLLQGIPIDAEGVFHGTILTLLNPQGLLAGVAFVLLFLVHGAIWLAIRTKGDVLKSAAHAARVLRSVLVVEAVVLVVFLLVRGQLSNPNLFAAYPAVAAFLMATPLVVAWRLIGKGAWVKAWVASAAGIVLITFCVVYGMFPALVPSSLDPSFSKTIANSASSTLTLKIMLGVVLVLIPIAISYQAWVYYIFSKQTAGDGVSYDEA